MVDESSQKSEGLPVPQEDWFLQEFVSMVNGSGTEFGVTLTVGGLIISGHLASGHRYFEAIRDDLRDALSTVLEPQVLASYTEHLDKHAAIYNAEDGQGMSSSPTWLHLRDAKIFHQSGAAIPGNQGVWWRGRISEVDGWWMGVLGKPQP